MNCVLRSAVVLEAFLLLLSLTLKVSIGGRMSKSVFLHRIEFSGDNFQVRLTGADVLDTGSDFPYFGNY